MLDACTNLQDAELPEPGDVSICLGCASLLIFTAPPQFRLATPEEAQELANHPQVAQVIKAVLGGKAKQ